MTARRSLYILIVFSSIFVIFGILGYIQFLRIIDADKIGSYHAEKLASLIKDYKSQGMQPKLCQSEVSNGLLVIKEKDCRNTVILTQYDGKTPYNSGSDTIEIVDGCNNRIQYKISLAIDYNASNVVYCSEYGHNDSFSF